MNHKRKKKFKKKFPISTRFASMHCIAISTSYHIIYKTIGKERDRGKGVPYLLWEVDQNRIWGVEVGNAKKGVRDSKE